MNEIDALKETPSEIKYGGIRRLPYAITNITPYILIVVFWKLIDQLREFGLITMLIFLTLLIFISASLRLKNTGTSPWFCLLLLVPILNLSIIYRCFSAQEGYEESQEFDTPGVIIASIYVLTGIASFIGIIYIFLKENGNI